MKHLFLILCLLLSFSLKSQTVLNTSTIPAHPTDADTVYLIVDLAFSSGNCDFHHSNAFVGGGVTVDLYHCTGMLTVICYTTDTILLGVMPAGNYQCQISVYSAPYTGPDACSNFTQNSQNLIQLQVDFANKVNEPDASTINVIYNSRTQSFNLEHSKGDSWVTLYSADGKIVFQGMIDSSFKVAALAKGVYLYSVKDERGVMIRGKVGVE